MTNTNTATNIKWEDGCGFAHCVAIATGKNTDQWYIYDLVSKTWGNKAEIMRNCLKPGTKRYEVNWDGRRSRYTTLAAARRAVENHAARMYP
jgi:hypothetical protein